MVKVPFVRRWREAGQHGSLIVQEIDFDAIDECRDSWSGLIAPVEGRHLGLGKSVQLRHGQ